jgi:NADH:ubiquinone oxidoreductase subunit 6 (subunit J)
LSGSVFIFYLLAALTLGFAVIAVSSRQSFRAAIYLDLNQYEKAISFNSSFLSDFDYSWSKKCYRSDV